MYKSIIRLLLLVSFTICLVACNWSANQPVTAREAFPAAQAAAQKWQADSWLYLVETTFEPDQLDGKAVFWQFYFISPSANQILSIVTQGQAVGKQETRSLTEQRKDDTLPLTSQMFSDNPNFWRFDLAQWQIDSDLILDIARGHARPEYLRDSSEVICILSRYPGLTNDKPVWQVFYKLNPDSLENPILIIDAATGQFIEEL